MWWLEPLTNSNQNSGGSGEGRRGGGGRGCVREMGAGAGSAREEGLAAVSVPAMRSRRRGWGTGSGGGVGKAEGLGCVRRAVLCKAFPGGERVCSVRAWPSVAGPGAPCSARARDVGAQPWAALATRNTWGLSRPGGAPCVGGEPSGQTGHLAARAGRLHQVGDGSGAFAQCGVRGVGSRLSLGVAAERGWWVPPRSPRRLLRALLRAVDLWKGGVGPSPIAQGGVSLESDLEFGREREWNIYLCIPVAALGSQ